MSQQSRHVFPCDPATPSRARAWALTAVRTSLENADSMLLDDVALVVSELVTNAMRSGSRTATLILTMDRGHLRVAVRDEVAARPRLVEALPGDPAGRGLHIVAALSEDWGFTRLARGKEVWAELALVQARAM